MLKNKAGIHGTLIFLHIPKTAGSSLRKVVERFYSPKEIYLIYEKAHNNMHDRNDFKALSDSEKLKIKIFMGHVSFGLHNYIPQACSYVTMLRDPIEKAISLFSYVSNKDVNHRYYKRIESEKMSLADFINSGMAVEADNHQVRVISGIEPEFGKCTSELLEIAKENLKKHFLVIGLAEYFDESVLLMKRTFGWRVPLQLSLKRMVSGVDSPFYEKTNVSVGRPRKEDLSSEDLAAVKKYNELDIQLYLYARELFQEQINQQGPSFTKELEKIKRWREAK